MPRTRNGICVDVHTVTDPAADVPVGDHAAALERRGVRAAEVEALAEDVRGVRERPVDVARLELDVREVVVAQLVVQDRRAGRERRLRVEHGRQPLVLDVDQLGRVLGDGARARHDGRDGLADEAHAVEREHVARARLRPPAAWRSSS